MNVLLTLLSKSTGAVEGTKRINLPLFYLPTNVSSVFYIEPDETLTAIDSTFEEYDCLCEVL